MRFPTRLVGLLGAALCSATPGGARAVASAGVTVESVQVPTLSGGTEPLTSPRSAVNVILFWRPDQEHSLDALRQLARCEARLAGKPVHVVAVVSGSYPRTELRAAVEASGLRSPVLLDLGDEIYGRLEVRQHPLALVADAAGKLALVQPYLRLRYCEIIEAHVRYLLKEIDGAQLASVMNPPRATMPGDDQRSVARRYVRMGKLEAEEGRCDRAVEAFRKALEIAGDDAEAAAGIARCGASAALAAGK